MLKYFVFLAAVSGIHFSSSNAHPDDPLPTEVLTTGIKKNEVGANGRVNYNSSEILFNFRNPIIDYLFRRNQVKAEGPPRGTLREIRHSQSLIVPELQPALPQIFRPDFPILDRIKPKKSSQNLIKSTSLRLLIPPLTQEPILNHTNYESNRKILNNEKYHEKIVTSQLLHVNENFSEDNEDERESADDKQVGEFKKIETYPATAFLINTFNRDGTLKSSVTHFQPNFPTNGIHLKAFNTGTEQKLSNRNIITNKYEYSDKSPGIDSPAFPFQSLRQLPERQFDGYPLVNEPANLYDLYPDRPSVYSAVSSLIEYEMPENSPLGIISPSKHVEMEGRNTARLGFSDTQKNHNFRRADEEFLYDEVTVRSDVMKTTRRRPSILQKVLTTQHSRNRRDTTSVILKTERGEQINVSVEEPQNPEGQRLKIGESDLVLRKGGIAIAGPGGAATAYTGGTAIVGPYGTVYKSPEGTAILGPFGKVVNITDDTDFEDVIKMHLEMQNERHHSPLNILTKLPGNGFKNFRNVFSYITNRPLKVLVQPQRDNVRKPGPSVLHLRESELKKAIEDSLNLDFKREVLDAPVEQVQVPLNETSLIFRPKSKAEAGRHGVAVSAPISHAILFPGQKAKIIFEPEAVASAGPAGFAHAHSDLFVSYVSKNATKVKHETQE